jgi:hypothetical protein
MKDQLGETPQRAIPDAEIILNNGLRWEVEILWRKHTWSISEADLGSSINATLCALEKSSPTPPACTPTIANFTYSPMTRTLGNAIRTLAKLEVPDRRRCIFHLVWKY